MDARINSALAAYKNAAGLKVPSVPSAEPVQTGSVFTNMVNNVVNDTVTSLKNSEAITSKALVQNIPLDQLAVTVSDAETSLRTVVAIRDKIIQAYQDIMKMPI